MDLLEGMVGPFSGTANRSAWLGRLFAGKQLYTAYIGLVTAYISHASSGKLGCDGI